MKESIALTDGKAPVLTDEDIEKRLGATRNQFIPKDKKREAQRDADHEYYKSLIPKELWEKIEAVSEDCPNPDCKDGKEIVPYGHKFSEWHWVDCTKCKGTGNRLLALLEQAGWDIDRLEVR